ncbi:hypothetical protein ABZ747_10975 [Kitasatospora cineracea]|uniref:hypothetical protein n=1 Tax=Kitasatospora cineracea TaxID=88074 RepID=UPI0034091E36
MPAAPPRGPPWQQDGNAHETTGGATPTFDGKHGGGSGDGSGGGQQDDSSSGNKHGGGGSDEGGNTSDGQGPAQR